MATPSPAGQEQASDSVAVEHKKEKDCTNVVGHGNLLGTRLFCQTCGGFINRHPDY